MRRRRITETNSVNIVFMFLQSKDRLSCLDIVDDYRAIAGASYDFSAVSGKSNRPDLEDDQLSKFEHARTYTHSEMRDTPVVPPTRVIPSQIGEVQHYWVRLIAWICRSKTHQVSNGAIGEIFIVRTQSCVRNSPLAKRVIHCLVIFPLERVGSVVHSDLEVLRAAEEEVAVIGELPRVASCIKVDNLICNRTWYHVL